MTAGYAMPFWLWVGILAFLLSFAIPKLIGMWRKRKTATGASPSGIVAKRIRGDLLARSPYAGLAAQIYRGAGQEMTTEFDLLIDVHAVNLDTVPTTFQRFDAEAEIEGQWIPLRAGSLDSYQLASDKEGKYRNSGLQNVLSDKHPLVSFESAVNNQKFTQNVGYRGWVAFTVPMKVPDATTRVNFHIWLIDGADRRWPVSGSDPMGEDESIVHAPEVYQ